MTRNKQSRIHTSIQQRHFSLVIQRFKSSKTLPRSKIISDRA
ncbi:hypothetical protein [Okeania sp. SIO1I7]|nr:hypothetical protein [Okeania sp. SIO1I7]